jgi:EmrB/QacA subfamily drug resistance transporter
MKEDAQSSASPQPLERPMILRIMAGVMLAMLLGAMDQTIVAPALPTMGRELGNFEYLPWVVTAYLVSATAVTPLYGKLCDIHGRRTILLIAVAIFLIGSVFCALAPNLPLLILARFLQGIGGGGLIALPQTIVGDMIPPRERPKYQAYVASVFMAASIIGPVFGGFFAQHLHWSLIFWINLPIGVIALAMTWNALRLLPQNHRPRRLDIIGAVLIILATIALLLALSWAGHAYAWGSWQILSLFALSLLAFVLFVLRAMTASEAFIPLTVLFNPIVATGVAAGFFAVGAMIGLTIFVPMYFEVLRGLSSTQSGFGIMAMSTGTVIGAMISGRMMGATPHYKRPTIVGLAFAAIGTTILAITAGGLPLLWFEALLALIGIGIGTHFPLTTVSVQNAVEYHELGTATANLHFFRQLGSAVVVSIYSAVFLDALGSGVDQITTLDALAATAAETGIDLSAAFRLVFFAAAATLVLSFVAIVAMKESPLRGAAERARSSSESS